MTIVTTVLRSMSVITFVVVYDTYMKFSFYLTVANNFNFQHASWKVLDFFLDFPGPGKSLK